MTSGAKFKRLCATTLVSIAACAITISSKAQQSVCGTRTVSVNVDGPDGQFVSNLTAANLHATLAGQALSISSVTINPSLRRIIFIIHTSGSMSNTATIRASLSLTADMVNRLPADVEFALVTFNDDSHLNQPFTRNRAALGAALHRMDDANYWRGSSAVFDAVNFGIQELPNPSESDAIVLISNGNDNASRADLKGTIESITHSRIRVFTVGVATLDQMRTVLSRKGQRNLDELATASGGESFSFASPDSVNDPQGLHMEFVSGMDIMKISENADSILHEMASGYRLEISLPVPIMKPTEWNLEVIDGEKVRIRYPKKLFPCSLKTNKK